MIKNLLNFIKSQFTKYALSFKTEPHKKFLFFQKFSIILKSAILYQKRKELVSAKEVLKSVSENYPKLKIDIILKDALYYSKECFSFSHF